MSHEGFFSTTAQVIPLLLVLLIFESREARALFVGDQLLTFGFLALVFGGEAISLWGAWSGNVHGLQWLVFAALLVQAIAIVLVALLRHAYDEIGDDSRTRRPPRSTRRR